MARRSSWWVAITVVGGMAGLAPAWTPAAGQQPPDLPTLALGQTVSGEIDEDTGPMSSPYLDVHYGAGTARGLRWRISVDAPGAYVVGLETSHFWPWVIVRDAAGRVVAEEDLWGRVQLLDLVPGQEYVVHAGSATGRPGPFRLAFLTRDDWSATSASRAESSRRAARDIAREYGEGALLATALFREVLAAGEEAMAANALAWLNWEAMGEKARSATDIGLAAADAHLSENCARLHFYGAWQEWPDSLRVWPRGADLAAAHDLPAWAARFAFEIGLGQIVVGQPEPGRERMDRGEAALVELLPPSPMTAELWYEDAGWCFGADLIEDGLRLLDRSVVMTEELHGPTSVATATALDGKARRLLALGRYDEALALHDRSIGILTDLGLEPRADHRVDLVNALSGRATCLRHLGRYDEARAAMEDALAVVVERYGDEHRFATWTRETLAQHLVALEEYAAARPLLERAVEWHEEHEGPDSPTLLSPLRSLDQCLTRLGHYREARLHQQRQVDMATRLAGPDVPFTMWKLFRLADTLYRLGEYDESRALYARCLAIARFAGLDDSGSQATLLNNASLVETGAGRYEAAIAYLEQAVALGERHYGPRHAELATTYGNLAGAYAAVGRFEDAREHYELSLSIHEETQGPTHTRVAWACSGLAGILANQNELERASALWERTLAIYEQRLGPTHHRVAETLGKLAVLRTRQARFEEAEDLARRQHALLIEQWGADDVQVAPGHFDLGKLRRAQGRLEEAEAQYRRALDLRREALGDDHLLVAMSQEALGDVLREQGRLDEAEPLLQQALATMEARLGAENVRTARRKGTLSRLLEAQGRASEGREMFEQSLLVEESVLGSGAVDPERLYTLALLLHREGRLLAAMRRAEDALSAYAGQFGPTHPGTARCRRLLGTLLLEGGEPKAARGHLQAAVDLLRRSLGERHPDTADALVALAGLLEQEGDGATAMALQARALDARLASLGPLHAATVEARAALARLAYDHGSADDAAEQLSELVAVQEAVLPEDHAALQASRGLLARALEAQGRTEEATRVRGTIRAGAAYPPLLSLLSPAASPATVSSRRFTLDVSVVDYLGVEDVVVELDGEAVSATSVAGAFQPDETGRRVRVRYPVSLPVGRDEVRARLWAVNREGIHSEIQALVVRHEAEHRDLYVLALGVSDYDDDRLDLAYPVKDVDDLVARLAAEASDSGLYSEVHVERLADAAVTPGAVRKLRHEFLRRAQPDDTILVFAAGHGVRTADGEYYFLTADSTPDEPYGGVDRPTLESLVTWEKLYAQRRVLLMDTCHAGATLDEATRAGTRGASLFEPDEVDEVVDLTGSGIYIIAASADDGFAQETSGNGLFTRALLDGLSGDADVDGDGYVRIEELKDFARRQVHERSGGRQRPTVPTIRGGEDFPLARVP